MTKSNKRILTHITIITDLVAALIVSFQRPTVEGSGIPILATQNIPLALVVLFVLLALEIKHEKMESALLLLALFSGVTFLVCSFALPPIGPSSDYYPILSYGSLTYQLGITIAALLWKSPRIVRSLAMVISLVALSTIAGYINSFNFTTNEPEAAVEAAVVLGARAAGPHTPGSVLKDRLNAALKMFKKGLVQKIVVTGAVQAKTEAWYLAHNGVPDSAVIMERSPTYCTSEQANFIRKVLIDSLGIKRIAVVTSIWHMPRALLMCHWQGVEAEGIPAYSRLPWRTAIHARIHESAALQVYVLFGS